MRWGDHPGILGEAQYNYKGPYETVAGRSKSVVEDVKTEARARRSHELRNAGSLWKLESTGNKVSPIASKRN